MLTEYKVHICVWLAYIYIYNIYILAYIYIYSRVWIHIAHMYDLYNPIIQKD